MRQSINYLTNSYSHKSSRWVLAMLLSMSLLPVLLKSVFMLIKQNSLSLWLVILFDMVGWAGAWLLLVLSIRSMDGHHGTNFRQGLWKSFTNGGLWLIAMALLSETINKLYISYGGLLVVTGYPFWYLVGMAAVILLISLLMSVFTFYLINIIADKEYYAFFPRTLGYLLRKPLFCLGTVLSVGLLLFGIPLIYDFIIKNLPGLSLSFLELAAGGVLLSFMQWVVFQPLLTVLFKHAGLLQTTITQMRSESGEVMKKPVPFVRRYLSILTALAVIIASGIYGLLSTYPVSAVSAVTNNIEYYLSYGKLMGKAGDPAAAVYYFKLAEARILAWQGAVPDQPDALNQAYSLAPSDEQIQFLAALKTPNSFAALEQGFLNENHSKAWYLALLDSYAKSPALNDVQKQRKNELLKISILQGYFSMTSLTPDDFKGKQDGLLQMLDKKREELVDGKYYQLLARVGEEGGITRQLVYDTLDLAEKYRSELKLQYLAMSYGSTFLEDNATHYARTADAALRYDALYMEQKAGAAKENEIVKEKISVAKSLLALGQLQKCADFLSGLTYKNTELIMLKASSLFSLKSYEQALGAVSDLLKENRNDPQALYMASISALQLNDISGSIEYAIRMAKLIETADNKLETERLLYPFLLRFTLNDSAGKYKTETYSRLTEDQAALLKSDEFLYNYITAAYLWAKQDNESRNIALTHLDKVLSVSGSLSRAKYMKGAILFELGRDDEALEFLKSSLALDDVQPTVWYALANLYDKQGKYKEAYAATQKVLDYLPSNNHNSDVFGVSIHASNLMDKLKQYVKGEE